MNLRLFFLCIRFRRYNQKQDSYNYYREQIMLYLPWRCEQNDIIAKDCKLVYHKNVDTIKGNKKRYCAVDDKVLDEAMENVFDAIEDIEEEEIETFNKNQLDKDQEVDIFEQAGKETVDHVCNRYTAPEKLSEEDVYKIMEELNVKQREIVMHTLHCVKTNKCHFIFS